MNIRFLCPGCERPARARSPRSGKWQCPHCDHLLPFAVPPEDGGVHDCAVCGNQELYKKKDFPHWLGLTILAVACLAFLLGHKFYHPWVAWAVLIASAGFDGLLYLWVGDVVVCYRCGAHYRGIPRRPDVQPFELGVAERYRQERLRRRQLQADRD